MELKVGSKMLDNNFMYVPNVPYGVESLKEAVDSDLLLQFLMYRMELKGGSPHFLPSPGPTFLMYRMELKEMSLKCFTTRE